MKFTPPKVLDPERHRTVSWIFLVTIGGSLFVGLGAALRPDITGVSWVTCVLAAGIFAVLYFFHQLGFGWPKLAMVLAIALLASFAYEEPYVTEQTHLIIILPTVIATLLVDRVRHIVVTSLLVGILIVVRAGAETAYLRPDNIAIWVITVTSLTLSRFLVEKRGQRLLAANQELARKDELKTKYVSVLSHETQTPLTELRVSSELLLEEVRDKGTPVMQKLVDTIAKSSGEITRRVSSMFTLLEAEERGVRLSKDSRKLKDLIESVLLSKMPEIKARKLNLKTKLNDLPALDIDLEKMRLCLINLVDNTIIYSPEGGKVEIQLKQENNMQILSITDEGIGIPLHEQSNIFESFHRASNAFLSSPDGEGVGLAISKHIVEAHGGTIGFKSKEGEGSSFWVELPNNVAGPEQPS
jgi:signal transduction histidine kinase